MYVYNYALLVSCACTARAYFALDFFISYHEIAAMGGQLQWACAIFGSPSSISAL